MNPVYVILDVDYCDDYGQSLKWIAPEIADEEGLVHTEEDDDSEYAESGGTAHNKWAGVISPEAWFKLRDAWSLDKEQSEPNLGMITEYGHLEGYRFDFDGMDWNTGGSTPILLASLSVSIPQGDEDEMWENGR